MIPGVTYHPRAVWEDPNLPVHHPGVYNAPTHYLSLVDKVIAHYTAADNLIDGDPGEHASNLPAYLRAIQRDYRTNRGYSIGYSWAIDWLGGVWELRGWQYRPAATAGRLTLPGYKINPEINRTSFAILCLVDGNDPLTEYAVEAFRKVVAEIERRVGRTMDLGPHSKYDPTGCCGDGIRAQLSAGKLRPQPTEPKPPIPPEDDLMANVAKIRLKGYADQFALIPLGPDTNQRLGLDTQAPIVVHGDPAAIERDAGYKLTPTKDGQ